MLKEGHKVTMLSSETGLTELKDIGPHNMANQASLLNNYPNFSYTLGANVKNINGGKVTYTESSGQEKFVEADTIVIWSGTKPRLDEAAQFIGSADQVLMLGDCTPEGGTVQKAMRSAFFVASQV
jgi:hypothetical protein